MPTILVIPQRIATVPSRNRTRARGGGALRVLPSPLRIPSFTLFQAWHEVHRGDPAHPWLRKRIADEAAK